MTDYTLTLAIDHDYTPIVFEGWTSSKENCEEFGPWEFTAAVTTHTLAIQCFNTR